MAIDTSVVNIDFEVLRTNTCKALRIEDLSHWASFVDDTAYISILTPGSSVPVTHIFQKEKRNIFNVVNLNLSDVTDYSNLTNLPDGMYTITVERCVGDPNSVTKYHLQDCSIRCSIVKRLIAVDLTCTPCRKELLKKLQDVLLFLEGAQAQTDRCNVNKAMEYYQRAALILSRISDTNDLGTSPCINC